MHTIGPAYSSHIAEFQNHKNTHNFLVYSFPIFLHTCVSYQWAAGSLPFSLWSFWVTLQRGLTPSRIEKEDKINLWHPDSSYPGQAQHPEISKPDLEAPKRHSESSPKRLRNLPKDLQEICGRTENVSYLPSTSASPKMSESECSDLIHVTNLLYKRSAARLPTGNTILTLINRGAAVKSTVTVGGKANGEQLWGHKELSQGGKDLF